ncbi:MAG TPA: hypothetical protein DIT13_05925 [Verrucomicrobiales bacterium]|nr:hypothetical protein [Verrucomicrobiales bacterium]HRJ08175.1 DUF3445 domain-containing protein [Prosthecobacter sp.]HRK14748.1 DUF3445 domain-containing protein [Prosthecobacter sp.]
MTKPDWNRIFSNEKHRLHMALRRSDLTSYWRGSNGGLLKERKKWVEENQSRCLGVCDDASLQVSLALREIALLSEVDESRIERLAVEVVPDWTLLSRASGLWRVVAGAVVFPSSWALNEKLGRPLFEVHGPVPGLNPTLGASIDIFLDSLTQFTAWERWNWGLPPILNSIIIHPGICQDLLQVSG